MIWMSFARWSASAGMFFVFKRIYRKGRWTPFVKVKKRYKTWLGYWGK
jgi:hypothetical protein